MVAAFKIIAALPVRKYIKVEINTLRSLVRKAQESLQIAEIISPGWKNEDLNTELIRFNEQLCLNGI